jgi:hypothetical protein
MLIIDGPNLERLPGWFVQRGASINPVDVNTFVEQQSGTGPLDEYIAAPAFGGALAAIARPIPVVDGKPLPYVEHSYQRRLSADALQFGRNIETDWVGCWPAPSSAATNIAQKANGSCQQALYRGGMWQFPAGGPWADSGFASGDPAPDTWDQVTIRYLIDWTTKLTISPVYLSASGQTTTTFASAIQNAPFTSSNWTRSLANVPPSDNGVCLIQYQLDNNDKPAAFEVQFQAVQIRWSDQPFS